MTSFSKNPERIRLELVRDDSGTAQPPVPETPVEIARLGTFHNLPHLPYSFVGRGREVSEVGNLLERCRLVTVTGPGGIGKTSVALRVAATTASAYPDGVWWADLAALADPTGVPQAVSAALPWAVPVVNTAEDVVREISHKQLLLVLDNCEHLVDACAHVTQLLLRSCSKLRVLATSRETLDVPSEQTWTLGPLSLPARDGVTAEELLASEAGALFVQRVMAITQHFECTDAMAPSIVEICRRVDGIPLAIEFAAARMGWSSTFDILERLDDGIAILNTGSRTVMPRHQTLTATLEWSHDLLTPAQAVMLRRLSVFSGWTLEAAESVCAGDGIDRSAVVDLVAGLVKKSLVVAETQQERSRYRLLDTVRAWTREKLDTTSDGPAVRRRHATWCLALAERADRSQVRSTAQRAEQPLDAEHANLRGALEWARSTGESEIGVRLVTALLSFWRVRGHTEEALRWLDWAILAADACPLELQAKLLRAAGSLQGQDRNGNTGSAPPLQSSALSVDIRYDNAECRCNRDNEPA